MRFSVTEVYLRRFSAERALSLSPAILSRANRRSHLLTRASRVPIFKAISLPLNPLEAKRIILARSTIRCSVLALRIQRKRISFSLVESRISGAGRLIDLFIQLLRCQLQVSTSWGFLSSGAGGVCFFCGS